MITLAFVEYSLTWDSLLTLNLVHISCLCMSTAICSQNRRHVKTQGYEQALNFNLVYMESVCNAMYTVEMSPKLNMFNFFLHVESGPLSSVKTGRREVLSNSPIKTISGRLRTRPS
jgi:hypothetical protein